MKGPHHYRRTLASGFCLYLVTVLVDEWPDGVHLTYDKMASLLAPYRNVEALAVQFLSLRDSGGVSGAYIYGTGLE